MEPVLKLYNDYKLFVLRNPEAVTNLESVVRWLSYLVPTKPRDTAVLSELLFCASKVMILMNDNIYEHFLNAKFSAAKSIPGDKILKFLKVVNCVEVFTELAGANFGGNISKWVVIVIIQLIKVACRLLLLFKYKYMVIQTTGPQVLNRDLVQERLKSLPKPTNVNDIIVKPESKNTSQPNGIKLASVFTLESSGRVIRTLAAGANGHSKISPQILDDLSCPKKIIGELIYTFRPLLHLFSMGVFGQKSWMPWLMACGADIASVHIATQSKSLQPNEMRELNQRSFLLMLYLLRSPFYSKYSKRKIIGVLRRLKRILPIGNILWTSLENYAEIWDQIYFYSWES